MDQIAQYILPMRQFSKDSTYQIGQEVHKARQKRIPEDCDRDRNRVRHHGLHRVLREANSQSHQQHHRRSITDNF
jgi:hypothetical protein